MAYIVPKDFREKEEAQFGDERTYYGYVVRVYYDGILQDQEGYPSDLLELVGKRDVSAD
jgi:hypothetical protein